MTIKTLAYNGQVRSTPPREGACDDRLQCGQFRFGTGGLAIDSLNDGAMEEGSPMIWKHIVIPLHQNPGTGYHTHASAYEGLAGSYSGQFDFY